MEKQLKQVKEFHDAFEIKTMSQPTLIPTELWSLRGRLLDEELEEYGEACVNDDLVGVADALVDQMYILLGTIHIHGMQDIFIELFNEVHKSNMSKLGPDGKPVYRADGKVLKGPDYFPPYLAEIVMRHVRDSKGDHTE